MEPPFVAIIEERARSDPSYEAAKGCLSAIREVVKSKGKPLTSVVVFAAASATLGQTVRSNGSHDVIAALVLIMRQCLNGVSRTCLAHHGDVITLLCQATSYASERADVGKSALEIALTVTDALFEHKVRPNNKIVKAILPLLTDVRSPVRHKSQHLILSILRRCGEGEGITDAAVTFEFFTTHIVHAINTTKVGGQVTEGLPVTHLVSLCEEAVKLLPNAEQVALCKALVGLAGKFGQHPLSAKVLDTMSSMLDIYDTLPDGRQEILSTIAAPLAHTKGLGNAQGVDVLFGCACARILKSTTIASFADEPRVELMTKFLELFKSKDPSVLIRSSECLCAILESAPKSVVQQVPELVAIPLLNPSYKVVYRWVFPVISAIFHAYVRFRDENEDIEALNAFCEGHFNRDVQQLVKALCNLRDSAMGRDYYIYGEDLDQCIGEALRVFGAQVLTCAPLQLRGVPLTDPQYELQSRSWMLPLLKQHIRSTRLTTFCTAFLPEASQLLSLSQQSAAQGHDVTAKKYRTLVDQIWELLPGFATDPIDLTSALTANGGQLGKQMCHVLVNESALQDSVSRALLAILKPLHTQEDSSRSVIQRATHEANRKVMVDYANRILPEMFTAYVKGAVAQETSGAEFSPTLLEAIQMYAYAIAHTPMLYNFFKTVVQRVLKASQGDGADGKKETVALCDLAVALLPALDKSEALVLAMNLYSPLLHDKEGMVQKSAYKGIRALYSHPRALEAAKTPADLQKFWDVLAKARETCEAAAIKQRLVALRAYLQLMLECPLKRKEKQGVYRSFLHTLVPEVMMRLRESGTQVRHCARECLQELCAASFDHGIQKDLVTLLCAGLAGTTQLLKSHALDALSRMLYDHAHEMAEPLLEQVADVVMVLLSDERTIYKTVLKFCKVVLYVFPEHLVRKQLPTMLTGIFSSAHLLSTSRMLVRKIVEKAVKRLDLESVAAHFPQKHMALLTYISKQLEKRKRKKAEAQRAGDDDDEEEEDENKNRKGFQEFMDEDEGDDRMHGSDPTAAFLDAWEREGEERKPSRKRAKSIALEIHEDEDVVDLFGNDTSAHLVATTHDRMRASAGGAKRLRVNPKEVNAVKTGEDGRFVVEESASEGESDSESDEKKEVTEKENDTGKKGLSKLHALRKKRASNTKKLKIAAKKPGGHAVQGLDAFAPNKKARGDAQKRNAVEPYAYVRLNKKLFKEKHKGKAIASFSTVSAGGKQALKGRKAKVLLNSHKNAKRKTKKRR